MVAAQGFWLAGETDLAALYREQALLGMERFRAQQADIVEANEPSGEFVYEESQLPGCTAAQVETQIKPVWEPWTEMEAIVLTLESRADFARYAEAQFEWRKNLLQRLPPCAEAVDLSLFLHQSAGIFAGLFGLDYAGVKQDNNVYLQANRAVADDIRSLLAKTQERFAAAE